MYCRWGGFPRCQKEEMTPELLQQILVQDVVERTIEYDLRTGPGGAARNATLVREVFRYASIYAGQAPNPTKLANDMGRRLETGIKREHVVSYMQFLADAMLVHLIDPIQMRARRQHGAPKICLCDHALRAAWLQEFVPLHPDELRESEHVADLAGHIMESVIGYYLAGLPSVQMSHSPERPGEPEVDFVLTIGARRIPIEVKYRKSAGGADDVAGLKHWIAKGSHGSPFGLLVTQDVSRRKRRDEDIIEVPAKYLLLLQ